MHLIIDLSPGFVYSGQMKVWLAASRMDKGNGKTGEGAANMEHMTAQQAAEAAKGLTFEAVWAAMMKTDARIEESRKETDARLEESQKKTDRILAELSKNIGGLGNSLGRLTEAIFTAELWKKFHDMGYPVSQQSSNRKFYDEGQVLAEVDLFIENGDYAILVEIKTDLSTSHVDDHLERIGTVRRYLDARGDGRKLIGAVAGGVVPDNVLKYAHRKGLFVVTHNGDAVDFAQAPQGFKAREW